MSLPIEDRKEVFVTSKNKELLIKLRNAISANFEKIWIFIYCDNVKGIFGIEVCNEWGSHLPKKKEETIKQFVNKWMKENS
jgi:hypothetical protein